MFCKGKKKVKWSSKLTVNDISPRKTRDYTYVILYTSDHISVCCSETIAQRLCIGEPYEMRGYLSFHKGGSYLVLERAKLFNGGDYFENIPSPPDYRRRIAK